MKAPTRTFGKFLPIHPSIHPLNSSICEVIIVIIILFSYSSSQLLLSFDCLQKESTAAPEQIERNR